MVDLTVRGGDRITVSVPANGSGSPPRLRFQLGHRQDRRLRRLGLHRHRDVHADRRRPTQAHREADGSHRYTEPGTSHVSVKVASSRSGRVEPFAQIENLDRVRVVVRP